MSKNPILDIVYLLSFMLFSLSVVAQDKADLTIKLTTAMNDPARPDGDKERDEARKPQQVIEFMGIESGMSVIDVMAGGGYYTELLAAAVGPEGKVISHNFEWLLQFRGGSNGAGIKDKAERYNNIEVLVAEFSPTFPPDSLWSRVNPAEWPVDVGHYETDLELYAGKMDAAFLGLNLHDVYIWDENDEMHSEELLGNIFRMLKPGGILGLTEHRGLAGRDNYTFHRMTDAKVKELLVAVGFEIAAESDILTNPLDDHSKFVFDRSLERNTDRMLIRASKPK